MKLVGKRIKERREELGYTQEQLGKLAKVNKYTISHLENEDYKTRSKKIDPEKLADALQCTVDYLRGVSDSPIEYSDKTFMPFSTDHIFVKSNELYKLVKNDIQLADNLIYMQKHFSAAEISTIKQLLSVLRKNHEQLDTLTQKKPSSR